MSQPNHVTNYKNYNNNKIPFVSRRGEDLNPTMLQTIIRYPLYLEEEKKCQPNHVTNNNNYNNNNDTPCI